MKKQKSIVKALVYFLAYFVILNVVALIIQIPPMIKQLVALGGEATREQIMEITSNVAGETSIAASFFGNIVALVCLWLFFKLRKKKPFEEVGIHKCDPKLLIVLTVFGVGFSSVVTTVVQAVPFPESIVADFTESYSLVYGGNAVIRFIATVILAPIAEEVFLRGLIYTRLRNGSNIAVATVVSALVFGLLHGSIIWILITFMMGVMLAVVFEKTGSLLYCILIHFANNMLSLLPLESGSLAEIVVTGILAVLMICSAVYLYKYGKKKSAS